MSRRRLAPSGSFGRQAGPPAYDAAPGAVAIVLFRRQDEWYLPLTVRPAESSRHAGQICLPGGLAEPGESSDQNAARELAEELGPDPDSEAAIAWLGSLAEIFVYVSNVRVIPWVAVCDALPVWHPSPREVDSVIEMPVRLLFDRSAERTERRHLGPLAFAAPCFRFGEHSIWGATAMILAEFAELFQATCAA